MFFSLDTSIIPNVRLIGHVIYTSPWMHFSRQINEYVMYIIKKGELFIEEEGFQYVLKQGDMLILEPNKMHSGYKPSLCDYYYIHFKHSRISQINDLSDEELMQEMINKRRLSLTSYSLSENSATDSICYMPKYYHIENDSEYILLLKEAVGEYQRKYEYYKEQVSNRVLDFMIRLCREYVTINVENTQAHTSKAFVKAQTILNYLNKEYHKKITSADIEQIMESNYDYLNRVFHKATGLTIFNYLNMVRINKAKEIMETTPLKFSEIGYLIGIDNPYYFSKLFKKYSGMTPTQYWEMANRTES